MNRNWTIAAALLLVVAALPACAPKFEEMSASEIYNYGSKRYDKRDYSEATEAYEALIDLYPFSTYVTKAEIRIADGYYERKRWSEAAVAYKDFVEKHPTNEDVPRAVHHEGVSHYKQRLAIDRDQEEMLAAEQVLARLTSQFPDYENINDGREKLADVRRDLAARERYVARFYWREKEYYASVMRWDRIIRDYADTEFLPEALYYSSLGYQKLDEPEEARRHADLLRGKFPDNKFTHKLPTP